MALKNSRAGAVRLTGILLTPSSISIVFALLVSIVTVGGTIILTHTAAATQQSLLGLHSVYRESSIGINTIAVGQHLSSNVIFNNGILFVLWGSVGLVVYSVIQGIVTELTHTDDILHEMSYIHADRGKILYDAVLKAIIRFVALAAWWLLGWIMLHKIFPYAIASAHLTTYNFGNVQDSLHTLLGFCLCLLSIHGLTVLLRLIVLRPRLIGNVLDD